MTTPILTHNPLTGFLAQLEADHGAEANRRALAAGEPAQSIFNRIWSRMVRP